MASREQIQVISAGVARDLIGRVVVTSNLANPVPVAIWPGAPGSTTLGFRAMQMVIRPITQPVWIRFDTPSDQVTGAMLQNDVEYVFSIDPAVNTLYVVNPVATSCVIRWVVGG